MKPADSESAAPSRRGLAITSLVLSLVGIFSSLFLVGALFGVAGLVLGVMHLSQHRSRNGLAWVGILLSAVAVGASLGFGLVYYPMFKKHHDQVFSQWQGVPAPDFSFTTLEGQTLTLRSLKGKRVVLDFWATWCPPCAAEIPHFIRLRNEQPANDLFIVGISDERVETLKAFVGKKGVNYPIATATSLPAPFAEVAAIPTTFFIDRNGVIRETVIGYHDFEELTALALANDYGGQPKPPPASSKH